MPSWVTLRGLGKKEDPKYWLVFGGQGRALAVPLCEPEVRGLGLGPQINISPLMGEAGSALEKYQFGGLQGPFGNMNW